MTQTNIISKIQIEGFHNFPLAEKFFPEASFLSERHRHIFWIECEKKVFHDNRDLEFILFSRTIKSYLYEKYPYKGTENTPPYHYHCEFGAMSCEAIARELLEKFELESCSVFEDNENGAKIFKIK